MMPLAIVLRHYQLIPTIAYAITPIAGRFFADAIATARAADTYWLLIHSHYWAFACHMMSLRHY